MRMNRNNSNLPLIKLNHSNSSMMLHNSSSNSSMMMLNNSNYQPRRSPIRHIQQQILSGQASSNQSPVMNMIREEPSGNNGMSRDFCQ